MAGNFEERDFNVKSRYSAGLSRRIDYLQNHADEMFSVEDFLSRLRSEYLQMQNNAVGLTNIEFGKLMQQSSVRFIYDLLSGYQQYIHDVETICRTTPEGHDFRAELEQWRDRLIDRYARLDISDWWSHLIAKQDGWKLMAQRLYETKCLVEGEASQLVKLIGNIGLMTSFLTSRVPYSVLTDPQSSDFPADNTDDVAIPYIFDHLNRQTILESEELFKFIHPAITGEEERKIHEQVKKLVTRQGIQEICKYLTKLESEEKIYLPQSADTAYTELVRMGMPCGDGFSIKTFMKYYKK